MEGTGLMYEAFKVCYRAFFRLVIWFLLMHRRGKCSHSIVDGAPSLDAVGFNTTHKSLPTVASV